MTWKWILDKMTLLTRWKDDKMRMEEMNVKCVFIEGKEQYLNLLISH